MHAFVRSVARRTSIGLGALALAVGVAACGGDDGQESAPEQDPGVEESAPEEDEQLDPGDGDEPPPPLFRLLRARWRSRREAALASAFAALRRFLASAFAAFASAVSVGTAFWELMPTAVAPAAAPPR